MSRVLEKLSIGALCFAALSFGPQSTKVARGEPSPSCPDADSDGHRDWVCGGDDCDDSDANRYPNNTEVCDAAGHDEDCDPAWFGVRDVDRDGEIDRRCHNTAPDGSTNSGTDLDDSNPAIQSGAQICNGGDDVWIYSNIGNTAGVAGKPCATGTKCIPQPNGTGVCGTPPPGYKPPAPTPSASNPVPLPSLQSLQAALRPKKNASLAPVKPIPKLAH